MFHLSSLTPTIAQVHFRCLKVRNELDGHAIGGRRAREHTEELLRVFDRGVLWDEYGVIDDLIVS